MVLRLDLTTAFAPNNRNRHRYGQQLARRSVRKSDTSETAIDGDLHTATHIAGRAALWAAPWDARRYPGRGRLLGLILGRSVTTQMVGKWRSGDRPLPVWAALALAQAIERRARAGLQIASDLTRYADEKAIADALKPKRGAWWRKDRASGVAPAALGARGKSGVSVPADKS